MKKSKEKRMLERAMPYPRVTPEARQSLRFVCANLPDQPEEKRTGRHFTPVERRSGEDPVWEEAVTVERPRAFTFLKIAGGLAAAFAVVTVIQLNMGGGPMPGAVGTPASLAEFSSQMATSEPVRSMPEGEDRVHSEAPDLPGSLVPAYSEDETPEQKKARLTALGNPSNYVGIDRITEDGIADLPGDPDFRSLTLEFSCMEEENVSYAVRLLMGEEVYQEIPLYIPEEGAVKTEDGIFLEDEKFGIVIYDLGAESDTGTRLRRYVVKVYMPVEEYKTIVLNPEIDAESYGSVQGTWQIVQTETGNIVYDSTRDYEPMGRQDKAGNAAPFPQPSTQPSTQPQSTPSMSQPTSPSQSDPSVSQSDRPMCEMTPPPRPTPQAGS